MAPMEEAKVAVVMRTRDRPAFLERALASVSGQTFRDFVLVVVNDGGDPAAVEAAVGDQGVVLHNDPAAGMQAASNQAIAASRSTFVAVHDDDDTWAPSFLEQTVGHLEDTGAMGVVATTDTVVEGPDLTTLEQSRLFPGLRFINLYALCFENYATPIAFLYRRSAIEEVGPYEEAFDSAGDWDFALRFAARYEIDVLATDEALAFYHHRLDSAGADANAVYADGHRRAENLVANAHLRRDIESGRAGLGLVINVVRFAHAREESLFDRRERASGDQIEYLAECIRKLDERVQELQQAVTPSERLKSDLAFLRSLPGRFARRSRD
jgi:glycosyltransferase involved in cell wall biosynthesis